MYNDRSKPRGKPKPEVKSEFSFSKTYNDISEALGFFGDCTLSTIGAASMVAYSAFTLFAKPEIQKDPAKAYIGAAILCSSIGVLTVLAAPGVATGLFALGALFAASKCYEASRHSKTLTGKLEQTVNQGSNILDTLATAANLKPSKEVRHTQNLEKTEGFLMSEISRHYEPVKDNPIIKSLADFFMGSSTSKASSKGTKGHW